MTTAGDRIVLIGVGNIYRGDDGAGPVAAREVASRGIPGVRVIDQVGDGTDLISAWDGVHTAYVVDCMRSGGEPGAVGWFDALDEAISEDIFPGYSTHAFSITDTIKLARILGRLPKHLIVVGIEGRSFAAGAGMSSEVEAAVKKVAVMLERRIGGEQ